MSKTVRPPFLFIPPKIESDTYIVLTKLSYYVKAMEEVLVRNGVAGFREVERIAMRNEALAAIDQINERLNFVRDQIAQHPDEMERDRMTIEWDGSGDRAKLTNALNDYKSQLAEALGDDV